MWSGLFLFLLAVSTGLVSWAWLLNYRLTKGPARKEVNRRLAIWGIKGLILPLVLWMVINIGISWSLQPFMPQIQAAQINGWPLFPVYMRVVSAGMFIVASYWSALTM